MAWIGVALFLGVVLPILNLLPAGAPLHLPDFYLGLLGKYLSLAILAVGLDLLWGYAGILSLCQAVFFGLGGYAIGMYLMLEIGAAQSKYGEAIPDFMVWNQLKGLPWFWKPFDHFGFAVLGVILVPALFAAAFGYLTFRSRIKGVYVSILTQALAFAAWLLFNRNEMNLGGTNGLTDFKTLLGFSLNSPATQRGLYVVTVFSLIGAFLLCRWIVTSKLGKIFQAIRDNEHRLRFCGFSTTPFKVFVFVLSAALAGLAGALYVPQVGIITPSQMGVLPSLEVVVWVALGGRGTLVGGALGAVVVNGLRTYLTTQVPQLWPFLLGGLFVGGVLFFPNGLVGLPGQLRRSIQRRFGTVRSPEPGAEEGPAATDRKGIGSRNGVEPLPSVETIDPGMMFKPTETIIYLEGVTVSFEGFLALRDLNFFMEKGELRFVIGPNGAGKTTLLDVISGKVKPAKGRVIFDKATDLLPLREHQIVTQGIGRKFQTPTAFPHHTVYDNLTLALRGKKGVIASLVGRREGEERERIEAILGWIGLTEHAGRLAGTLAHGQRQWLEIGMVMAQEPELLLIDEPVAGMTGREREETGLLLEAIAREHSVLVIEHDMEFVRHFAKKVTVLHEGTVLCEGPMLEVQRDPRVIEVYLGREERGAGAAGASVGGGAIGGPSPIKESNDA
ncbi:MAG: urea ABC transporter permease subunit UrtC [Nitrospirae bacterium]|nr:urea ABC transporter permease subunit UrtC [Candidatus Manganitrophaceae bacterium]